MANFCKRLLAKVSSTEEGITMSTTLTLRRTAAPLVLGTLAALTVSVPGSAAAERPHHTPEAAPARVGKRVTLLPRAVLPVEGYRLTGEFGDVSGLWSTVHTGLDFATGEGSTIHAVESGVVVSVGYDGAYGNKTVLLLDDGTELWFCHQSSVVVSVGDRVAAGDVIGYVGSTGNVTGPHLHLEVRPHGGDPVDPYTALQELGLQP
jgi:murein DD-endopeptidase MepM/ murein hydrolase activator NlpD